MKSLSRFILLVFLIIAPTFYSFAESESDKLNFGWTANLGVLPLIAHHQAIFTSNGIQVEYKKFQTGKMTMDALISGDIEIGTIVDSNVAFINFTENPLRVVAAIGTKLDDTIWFRKNSGIINPNDLKGQPLPDYSKAFVSGFTNENIPNKDDTIPDFRSFVDPTFLNSGAPERVSLNKSNETAKSGSLSTTFCRFPSILSALSFIAAKQGYFEREGVTAQFHDVVNGKICQDELAAGHADFAAFANGPFAYLSAAPHNLKILASLGDGRGVSVVARSQAQIKDFQDLKGKRVGFLPGTISALFLYKLFDQYQWTKKSLALTSLQPPAMVQAIQSGQIDAFALWEPWVSQATSALGSGGVRLNGREHYTYQSLLVSNDATLTKAPLVAKRVLKALVNAQVFISEEPKHAIELLSEFLKMNPAVVAESLKDFSFNVKISNFSIQLLDEAFRLIQKFEGDFADAQKPNFKHYIYANPLREIAANRVEGGFE